MSEVNVDSVDNQDNGSTVDESNKQDMVAYETHKRLLGQRKADQEKHRQVEAELEKLKAEAADKERLALEEQGRFKELAELREKELSKVKDELDTNKRLLIDGAKLQAFKEKVGASFKKPEYMSFVELDKIVLMEDGTFDEGSLDNTVNLFLKEHGDSLLNRASNKKLPNEAGRGGVSITKSLKEMNKSELKDSLAEKLKLIMTN